MTENGNMVAISKDELADLNQKFDKLKGKQGEILETARKLSDEKTLLEIRLTAAKELIEEMINVKINHTEVFDTFSDIRYRVDQFLGDLKRS